MKILITGGTGFIGSALARSLYDQNYDVTVLSRKPESVENIGRAGIHALGDLRQLKPNQSYQIIINLAGAPIFDSRWTNEQKKLIRNSRIQLTENLVACIAGMDVKPELLISGSAIGYYGSQGDTELTEDSVVSEDFSQQLCHDWEQAALQAGHYGVRVCLVRTGLVIANGGGLLQRLLLPFRLGLGGRLGDGHQWMSWIHRQDWIAIAQAMIKDATMHGAYNATAPNPVTNSEFTSTLAACLHRPALFPLPASLLKALLGEMSELLLGSQRVIPKRLLDQGFEFQYGKLDQALKQSLDHE
ncbi:MAG: TIGR01777 family oxidoreductase [Methylovulum sp.]|uniref:TIGR01777 family oxidoreductase n=1 Tax=Methylovulum sp. TaxID=1916980 RepID=UPI002606C763|nr:TIGR01777 family oxidoreductase [Methylovulum sp.]MDD2722586.1 TIGR01777 family oxidoreductase [Methylovulum sp.]MDD5123114.1 TIGR01777 family oxidoreductase [Methylovulum sp.]